MRLVARLHLVAALALALGCSAGQSPTGTSQLDAGVGNHLTPADGGGGRLAGVCGTTASFGSSTLDACIDSTCCYSFNACYGDASCSVCMSNPSAAGCDTSNLYASFATCAANCASGGGAGDLDGGTGGGGGGTTGGVCGSGASTGDATLDTCINTNCCPTFSACLADNDCVTCMSSSSPPATCDSNANYTGIMTCVSTNCGGGGGTGSGVCGSGVSTGDAGLDTCLTGSCCTSFNACHDDTTCWTCATSSTPDASCDSNALLNSLNSCWDTNCSGSGGGGGGTGGGVCSSGESTGDDTLDSCLSGSCCTSFNACYNDTTCWDCATSSSPASSCDSNSLLNTFYDCWDASCSGSGGGGGGGSGGVCGTGETTGDDTTDACLNSACCSTLDPCYNDATCWNCVTSTSPPSSCDSNSLANDFWGCWDNNC